MIEAAEIEKIIDQYVRHGWTPRRALFGPDFAANAWVSDNLEITNGEPGCIWFSRKTRPGVETWELRRLSGAPFALLAFIPETALEVERAAILAETEERMRRTTEGDAA